MKNKIAVDGNSVLATMSGAALLGGVYGGHPLGSIAGAVFGAVLSIYSSTREANRKRQQMNRDIAAIGREIGVNEFELGRFIKSVNAGVKKL